MKRIQFSIFNSLFTIRHSQFTIPILVFLAALLPRLYALGGFLTIDEVKWAEGAAQFLQALATGNLAGTYWHFFPGITIAWGSGAILGGLCTTAADLAACANGQVENLPQAIGWLRLWPVLLTSLGIVGTYLLVRRLLEPKVALLAALLLAFDPFFIAHSRILNGDTGAAILMFLALLAFLIYWLEQPLAQRQWRFLLLSALCAGLAMLTKLPAPLIGLFVGGVGLLGLALDWPKAGGVALRKWLVALLVWGGVALFVFVALWPALWVAPLATMRLMVVDAFEIGGAGAGHDTFFLGQISSDPGAWFYPYVIAFRLTPIVMVGLILSAVWLLLPLTYFVLRTAHYLLRHGPAQPNTYLSPFTLHTPRFTLHALRFTLHPSRFTLHASRFTLSVSRLAFPNARTISVTLVMVAYVVFILLFANLSPKKLDRYVMAVIPPLILLAAVGYDYGLKLAAAAFNKHTAADRQLSTARCYDVALTVLAAGQLLFAVPAAPYYLTYYNPLLGGVRRIADRAPAGWGEGLEQAAAYLNRLPNAESLTVSSWYSDIFNPYFVGQRASFADDGRAQLAADYVVFYINQIQRQKPFPGLLDYFRAKEPVFVVAVTPTGQTLTSAGAAGIGDNVPWVEVYQAPSAQSAGGAPPIEGVAQLLAYKVTGSRVVGSKGAGEQGAGGQRTEGQGAAEERGLARDEVAVTLYLRVLGPLPDGASFVAGLVGDQRRATAPVGEWVPGSIVEWRGVLTVPADLPAGDYRLWAGLQDETKAAPSVEFSISEKDPPLKIE